MPVKAREVRIASTAAGTTDEERRSRAEEMAIMMSKMMGLDIEDENSDEDDASVLA